MIHHLVFVHQIQDHNHEIRGPLKNQLGEIVPLLVHQVAHPLVDTLVLLLHNRQQTHDAVPARKTISKRLVYKNI